MSSPTQPHTTSSNIAEIKSLIADFNDALMQRSKSDETIETLLKARSDFIDKLLINCWRDFLAEGADEFSLVATGGYGRAELHPFSDIDLLIIFGEAKLAQYQSSIESFSTFLWDIGTIG